MAGNGQQASRTMCRQMPAAHAGAPTNGGRNQQPSIRVPHTALPQKIACLEHPTNRHQQAQAAPLISVKLAAMSRATSVFFLLFMATPNTMACQGEGSAKARAAG